MQISEHAFTLTPFSFYKAVKVSCSIFRDITGHSGQIPFCGFHSVSMEDLEGNDVQFQRRRACSSSEMNTNPIPVPENISEISIGAVSPYKSSIGSSGEAFFSSGWDSFGSFVSHDDPAYLAMVPKFPSFSSGNFSEMDSSFVLPQYLQIVNDDSLSNIQENRATGPSPKDKSRKRGSDTASFEPYEKVEKDLGMNSKGGSSDGIREQDQKKPKIDDNNGRNPTRKQAKINSPMAETSKENYIHVRARRGEATNSHSLAERMRREKISDRMKLLQELVPGCNKITGKAVMLDEIINYVQSLQQQVEFLSMKLATVNPVVYTKIEGEIHGVGSSQRVFARRMLSSQTGFSQFLENELQVHFQMGLDSG